MLLATFNHYLKRFHIGFHVINHVIGHLEIVIRSSASELEEPDRLEVFSELGLLFVEIADSLAKFANFHCLKRSNLWNKINGNMSEKSEFRFVSLLFPGLRLSLCYELLSNLQFITQITLGRGQKRELVMM